MSKDRFLYFFVLLIFPVLLIVFPSCVKTYKLAPSESSQGEEERDYRKIVKENIRSVKVYREWATDAMFDVLWFSPETTHAYVDLFCRRRGMNQNDKQETLKKEFEKLDKKIIFYVLADVRDKFHPSLTDTDATWTMYLKTGSGTKVRPKMIVETEFPPEILSMFGHRYSAPKFKVPYRVEFPVADEQGIHYLAGDKPFKLVMNSTGRKCVLGWRGGHKVVVKHIENRCKKKKRKFFKDEDCYWL